MNRTIPHLFGFVLAAGLAGLQCSSVSAQSAGGANIAVAATPTASYVSGDTSLTAMNNGFDPRRSNDARHGSYGNWNRTGTQWVQYEWSQPISTAKVGVFWWADGGGVHLPSAARLKYWNGTDFVAVNNAKSDSDESNAPAVGVEGNKYNTTTFDEVTTTKLRLEMDSDGGNSTGILQWKVYDSGKSPKFPPTVVAGEDRSVMADGKTYLNGSMKFVGGASDGDSAKVAWSKDSGPGDVTFADASKPETSATFSAPGDYVLKLTASVGDLSSSSSLKVSVDTPPSDDRLDVVYTKDFKVNSPLWNERVKALVVNWIPHCIEEIERTNIPRGQGDGGIDNFIEAGKALRGEPHGRHKGYVFANAWVHQTVESMSIALMIDPQGDKDMIAAQQKMRETLADWIPKILGAQEPDGYLQTAITLGNGRRWTDHGNHEGYTAGYFIESAINYYTMTDGKDKRLYDAAKRLADCWYNNIGPAPKKAWYDGHEEMEQALVRFGRFVNDMEGHGHGNHYIQLAKFLLDCRSTVTPANQRGAYDQTDVPVIDQYEAEGHAVRAAYLYSGMADVAAETHNTDYQSAVMSLWDNVVNKKYYVTGGIGSGQTSEGFGGDYELRNNAYCESCSTCGLIFFQWKMNLAYHDAKYADLYEESMYNALLGATDLEGKTFYYQNPLVGGQRTAWHTCPCCVGNIPRTLLMIPTWTYAKGTNGIYVNMYIGSTINVEKVAGTDIQMVQDTDYPWKGDVGITVNPKASKQFSVFVRIPNRTTSDLYTPTPQVSGYKSLTVNGKAVDGKIVNGYVEISRKWKKGDKIALSLPMEPQLIKPDPHIVMDRGLVALRYGPLIYNVERADQPNINLSIGDAPLTTEWRGDLLDGVMVIKGKWSDGSPLIAIPNFARNNRLGQVARATTGGDSSVNYLGPSGGAAASGQANNNNNAGAGANNGARRGGRRGGGGESIVWINDSTGATP